MFKTTLSKGIFIPSMAFILIVSLTSVIYPELADQILNLIKNFIFVNLNFILSVEFLQPYVKRGINFKLFARPCSVFIIGQSTVFSLGLQCYFRREWELD